MNVAANASTYTVAKVKSFRARNGYGFNADLLRDGRKVALVMDEGNGGCYRYEFTSREEEQAFRAHAVAIKGADSFEPDDAVVGEMVDAFETEKRILAGFKRHLKGGILFLLDGRPMQTKGKVVAVNQAHIDALRSRHPNAVILNALPEADALKLYRAHFVVIR